MTIAGEGKTFSEVCAPANGSRAARQAVRLAGYCSGWGMPARVLPGILLSIVAFAPAFASDHCATHDEYASLKVAALQQEMMVAALTCHQIGSYNRFVRSYRSDLQRSDHALLGLFVREDGKDGSAAYNAYKTKLANDSMLEKNEHRAFCRDVRRDFAALKHRTSLVDFVSSRATYVRLPFEDCGGVPAVSAAVAPPVVTVTHAAAPVRRKHRHGHHGASEV